eukprot:TRINITY_DN7527_c0_g1_i2.p1 TRINITY_DN7527_c0_g1~~TRINITY_DN7527_c0_g1_i2.p1  ORF type:complete len:531 (+),score=73.77 TRINITY_DN7527_c0_g1_i2:55-1647(+)
MFLKTRFITPNTFPKVPLRFFSSSPITRVTKRFGERFEVCVLGCGPSGYASVMRAYDHQKKVCVLEKGRIGGTALYNGALASKTLWELSEDYKRCFKPNRGYEVRDIHVDMNEISQIVNTTVRKKEEQMERQLLDLKIPLFKGSGKFVSPNEILVSNGVDEPFIVEADNFVVATGSHPRKHNHIHADGEIIMTSDHIHSLKQFPKSLVVLGAGVVGCEYVTIFSNYGKTQVYLIDKSDRILPSEDDDIVDSVSKRMEKKGVIIHHFSDLKSMEVVDGQVKYVIMTRVSGKVIEQTFFAEKALLSIGRVPNVTGLGLEDIGVQIDSRKGIINDDCQSTVPNIYAVGDTTQDIALVNVGEIEGRHVINKMFNKTNRKMSYNNVSSILFLDPQLACVGFNERSLQKNKIPYKVVAYNYEMVSRALAQGSSGYVKLCVSECKDMKILGIRALGPHADSVVEVVSLMIKNGTPLRDLHDLISAYPAIAEGLQECIRLSFGTSIFKPHVFPDCIKAHRVTYDAEGNPIMELMNSLV